MAEPSYFQYQGPGTAPGYTPPPSGGGWDWKSVLAGVTAPIAPAPTSSKLPIAIVVAVACACVVAIYLVTR